MAYRGIIITGTDASGKSTIARGLQDQFPDKYALVEAVTTRPSRPDDNTTGNPYEHVTEEEFQKIQKSSLFVKAEYRGYHYAVRNAKVSAAEKGKSANERRVPVLTITPDSAAQKCPLDQPENEQLEAGPPDFLTIFVDAPDDELDRRL